MPDRELEGLGWSLIARYPPTRASHGAGSGQHSECPFHGNFLHSTIVAIEKIKCLNEQQFGHFKSV